MDYNSTKNQEIKGKFIDIHVKACVTGIVEFILKASYTFDDATFRYDELENHCYYEDNNGDHLSEEEKEEKLSALNARLEIAEQQMMEDPENPDRIVAHALIVDELYELESAEARYDEIYEWWIVSGFLASKLEEHGEIMLNDGFNRYWGRTTTGQAILLDHVISKVCEDMEILLGQKNQWV
nr:hypothetical protein [Pedobacter panaciterrae]